MTMQTDVLSGHLGQSGFIVFNNRSRVKSISVKGTDTEGQLDLFATPTAPIAATYGQSGNTITITKSAHGLTTGQQIGIAYARGTGGIATCGNPVITVTGPNTFTITCPNSFTITTGAACRYVTTGRWLVTLELTAQDIYTNYFMIPGEGLLAPNMVYAVMTNINAVTVFYG